MFRVPMAMFALSFGLSGCMPKERDRCSVEGKATFQGQSLGGFHLALYSEATGGGSTAIQPDGSFQFTGPMQEGQYTVNVIIPFEVKGAAREKLEAMGVPKKYRKAETSDYKVTIQPGKNVLDIELKP
jgi:hypothetical protein